MKKILFLLFGVIFAIAGCADESSSSSASNETCPINPNDFTYEKTGINKYKIKLINKNKNFENDNVFWYANIREHGVDDDMYNRIQKVEPEIEWKNKSQTGYPKTVQLMYSNSKDFDKCGEPIIIKPTSNSKCDEIQIEHYQYAEWVKYPGVESGYAYIKYNKSLPQNSIIKMISGNKGVMERYDEKEQINFFKVIRPDKIQDSQYPFADLIIPLDDGTECIKEINFVEWK